MFPTTLPPPPSPRAQALAQRLAQLVQQEQQRDPSLQPHEVEQAFAVARQQVSSELGAKSRALALGLAVAAALIALGAALYR